MERTHFGLKAPGPAAIQMAQLGFHAITQFSKSLEGEEERRHKQAIIRGQEAIADAKALETHQQASRVAADIIHGKICDLVKSRGSQYHVRIKVVHDEYVWGF